MVFDQNRTGPLAAYRVIEMASHGSLSPICGRMMADAGAEVIKIEPFSGDPIRTAGKQNKGKGLYSAEFAPDNKDTIAVNLKSDKVVQLLNNLPPTHT